MNLSEKHVAAHYLVLRQDHPSATDITGAHFTHRTLRRAWDRARDTVGPIDPFALLGDELVAELSDVVVHPREIPLHIDALKSNWARQAALRAVSHASDRLRHPTAPGELEDILGELSGLVAQALAGGPHDSTRHSDLANDVARAFVSDLQSEDRTISTPWEGLNLLIPGIPFGKVTLVVGRSSEHKTTFARLLMQYAVEQYGLTGLFWTGEDSREEIARRCIASECPHLTIGRFSSGRWDDTRKGPTEDELRRVLREFEAHKKRKYWDRFRIEDQQFGNADHVCAFIRQQHAKHGVRVFVGDFIQLIEKTDTKSDWVSTMAKLCNTAKQLDIAMIWTSQVDKIGTKESADNNRPPRGIDAPFGTALRQQAYAVLCVGTDSGRLHVVVDKHKSAKSGDSQACMLDIDAPHDRLGGYPE
jgi:KaiC/GvpD/RAD55 family RecA-like ATPase